MLRDVGQEWFLVHVEHTGGGCQHGRVGHEEATCRQIGIHQVSVGCVEGGTCRVRVLQVLLGDLMGHGSASGYCTIVFDFDYRIVHGGWQKVRIQRWHFVDDAHQRGRGVTGVGRRRLEASSSVIVIGHTVPLLQVVVIGQRY